VGGRRARRQKLSRLGQLGSLRVGRAERYPATWELRYVLGPQVDSFLRIGSNTKGTKTYIYIRPLVARDQGLRVIHFLFFIQSSSFCVRKKSFFLFFFPEKKTAVPYRY